MRQSQKIILNTIIIWIIKPLHFIPQIILVPYLISNTGESGYGLYSLFIVMLLSIDQMEKSFQTGFVKYVSALLEKKSYQEINDYFYSSMLFSISTAFFISLILFYLVSNSNITLEYKNMFVTMAVCFLFILPISPFIALIQSKQYFFINNIMDLFSKYSALLIIMYLGETQQININRVFVATVAAIIFFRLLQIPLSLNMYPFINIYKFNINKTILKKMILFGSFAILINICLGFNNAGIRWYIEYIYDSSFVAHISIILLPVYLIYQIISPVVLLIMPATSIYQSKGDYSMLKKIIINGMKYINILLVLILLIIYVFIEYTLEIWLGDDYIFLSEYIINITLSAAVMWSTSIIHNVLKGIGHINIALNIYFISLVLVPILYFIIFSEFNIDKYYLCTGVFSISFIVCGLLNIYAVTKSLNVTFIEILIESYIKPLFILFPCYFSAVFSNYYFDNSSLGFDMVFIIINIVFFMMLSYKYIICEEDKAYVYEFTTMVRKKINSIYMK